MGYRRSVPFTVSLATRKKGEDVERWLDKHGKLVEDKTKTHTFRMYSSPTPVEKVHIQAAGHELFGGLKKWVDLEQGIDNARTALMTQIVDGLWPKVFDDEKGEETGGRAEATGKDLLAQEKAIEEAWDADDSAHKWAWLEMVQMRQRIEFIAMWEVLQIEPPPELATLNQPLHDDADTAERLFLAIWNAHQSATEAIQQEKSGSSKQ